MCEKYLPRMNADDTNLKKNHMSCPSFLDLIRAHPRESAANLFRLALLPVN